MCIFLSYKYISYIKKINIIRLKNYIVCEVWKQKYIIILKKNISQFWENKFKFYIKIQKLKIYLSFLYYYYYYVEIEVKKVIFINILGLII